MSKKVIKYQTYDGKLYDQKKKARDHEHSEVCDYLMKGLSDMKENGRLSASEARQVILGMIPDIESARKLRDFLNEVLYEDDEVMYDDGVD